jgi:hypothetical protein
VAKRKTERQNGNLAAEQKAERQEELLRGASATLCGTLEGSRLTNKVKRFGFNVGPMFFLRPSSLAEAFPEDHF